MTRSHRASGGLRVQLLLAVLLLGILLPLPALAQDCGRKVKADVVALDQVFFWNRLGAVEPQGMIFALRRDVVSKDGGADLVPGRVRLREGKRPRPLVLRMNVGDCLEIAFENLLAPMRVDDNQAATRHASVHVVGLQPVESIADDGSYVGRNATPPAAPGENRTYLLYAEREGQHVLYSAGTTTGGEGDGGHINAGLFGAVVVEPRDSTWYRSQLDREDWELVAEYADEESLPIIDYHETYSDGTPVLEILGPGDEIVHSEITAIVMGSDPAGPKKGWFDPGDFPENRFTHPERHQPFREFVIVYHDEIGAVQAFPIFEQGEFVHTLHSGRDAFAINYGTGGIGAEILANRFEVGPMHDCEDCKYEEFFLTSWAVGDPAMIVDVPANVPCMVDTDDPNGIDNDLDEFEHAVKVLRNGEPCDPQRGPKATRAFFPADPSNVYHSYLRDHTRFRTLHAGSKEHHIHHLHAHQWLYTGDSDESTYLDSQALGPGSSFTMEIAFEGGGNKNLTVGDSIFHCHFYPHFAQGMWALWRVHDVLEEGTVLDLEDGTPADRSRALPDGEIADGTPIPAVVPLPGKPMAPLPQADAFIVGGQIEIEGDGNPGFPFFVPGVAGKRPPHPPLDVVVDEAGNVHDGGLPRHLIVDGTFEEEHNRLDFHKHLLTAKPLWLDEQGEPEELAAMAFHAQREHESCEPDGTCADETVFLTNGRPAVPGAPYAEPCVDIDGSPVGELLRYKAADIQDDVVLNKKGWHFPQQRFVALWNDVHDYLDRSRPPEPLFFRANSRQHCIEYWLTNLVPYEYRQDDFQVRTPTDILGQHIHLVKFDVTSSDGAANGFNYEDGTFAPEEVRERIAAIREFNQCDEQGIEGPTEDCPVAQEHPFPRFQKPEWLGAQTTVQRWYPDPIRNNAGFDRTMRTVFTHDHFGPSTHQQAGLYAGLVVEPYGSRWFHNETGVFLGPQPVTPGGDGGPTSWQAVIEPPGRPDYREFLLEFADFQLAYASDEEGGHAINPPARKKAADHEIEKLIELEDPCPGGVDRPCPELISADDVGTMSVNYRNEPIALRVRDPQDNDQADGDAGDLSFAFASIERADDDLNSQHHFDPYPPLTEDMEKFDPFTPLLRAFENDRVQIRILVGAHEEGHNFSVHGVKWLFEPSWTHSGYRESQMMGISEHFEFIVPQVPVPDGVKQVDRLWSAGSSTDDYWNGIWGLLRTYADPADPDAAQLERLASNLTPRRAVPEAMFTSTCPPDSQSRPHDFDVTAVAAGEALPNGELEYNGRPDSFGKLFDPTAILYVRTSDLVAGSDPPRLRDDVPIEPLILRARAGECIRLTLRNRLPDSLLELDGWNALPFLVDEFNANSIAPSTQVGLHPQLVFYDVSQFDGANVGRNPTQTIGPGEDKLYEWYAGDVLFEDDGHVRETPIELGATNLISSDRIEHASKGAIGALIVEPENATWTEHPKRRAQARVENPDALPTQDREFREFVLVFQNDVNLRTRGTGGPTTIYGRPVHSLADIVEDPEDSGQKAINYRTEPLWKRMGHPPQTQFSDTDDRDDWWDVLHNTKVGPIDRYPETPVFTAASGEAIRFRLLHPGGHSRNEVFSLHGHVWDQEPYVADSRRIGRQAFSFWEGARMGHGPTNHFDAVMRFGAGGKFTVTGDYLYRDLASLSFDNGIWGILRVRSYPPPEAE